MTVDEMNLILYTPFSPVATVEVSVADGFGDVDRLHFLRTGEVGDGAGNLEDAAIGTGGEL